MGEWYSFNDQMQEMFGGKVYRLSLSSGCTCPNRDGTLSTGGCIFCSGGGSGDFAADATEDITHQIESAKALVRRKIGRGTNLAGYMAYFQSFTNTYGNTDRLTGLFEAALSQTEIVALSVATRPDCLSDEMIARLADMNEHKPVFVELGLQTIHEDTAAYINRCYTLDVFKAAFRRLKAAGLRVVVHVIIGLPGENAQRTIETVSWISRQQYMGPIQTHPSHPVQPHPDGIKLQLLYVLKGTRLAELLPDPVELQSCENNDRPNGFILLRDGVRLPQYTLPEYASLIRELAGLLPAETALHRVTGDPPKKDLILPAWTTDKKRVLNTIRAEFRR